MLDIEDVVTGEIHRFAVLIHIATATPCRYWTGDGYIELPGDDELDPVGSYEGIGVLTGIPALRQLVGGLAEQITVTFSGVDSIPRAWVHDPASDIVDAQMTIGVVFLDDAQQIATPVFWLWAGTVDVPGLGRTGMTKSVSLTVGSDLVDRARAALVMWANAAHQLIYPGDRFFERTAINNPFQEKWPA